MKLFTTLILTLSLIFINQLTLAQNNSPRKAWVVDKNHVWHVEVVDNEYLRAKGLMFRPYLLPNYGMLFVFDEPRPMSFWMKNTWIHLDMRFYDVNGRLITHYPHAKPCISKRCMHYISNGPVKYVLESVSKYRLHNKASNIKQIVFTQK